MPLLGNQIQAKHDILNAFANNADNSYYLAGEPGVGKTYITSSTCHDWLENHPKHHILIISPSNVMQKWHKVLKEYNPDTKIVKISQGHVPIEPGDINILSNHNLSLLDEMDNQQYQFVAYDEFHEVQPDRTNFERISRFLNRDQFDINNPANYHPNLLAITGTVFSQEYRKLLRLIEMTNPTTYYNHPLGNSFKLNEFINRVWQYISTTINLDNVKANLSRVEIKQDIMPIRLINLTAEEKAFYEFVQVRMRQIKPSQSGLGSDLLDFPSTDQFISKHTHRVAKKSLYSIWNPTYEDYLLNTVNELQNNTQSQKYDRMPRKKEYIAALTLNKITLTNTHKFSQLKQIIDANQNQSILVLLNSSKHLSRLETAINEITDRQTAILNPHTKPTKRAQTINDFLNSDDDNIMLANANNIKTGIDLNSVNVIVWYQLLDNLSDILQTQRRAQRLNSQQNSKVYYLAYKDTEQEELIKQLSESNTNNASAYGSRSTDALSQLQGILFKDFR